MTEDHAYCVRGCRRRCRDDGCLIAGECDHDTRIRATIGLLCDLCAEQLAQAVAEIPDLFAGLPGIYDTGRGPEGDKLHSAGVSGSPALIRLDVLVLSGLGGPGWGRGEGGVWGTIYTWLRVIEEELGLKPQGYTLTEVASFLRTWRTRICAQPWIDEMWSDVVGLWRSLRRSLGSARPIGRCWGRIANRTDGGCGRLLYAPPPGADRVVCPNEECGRTYDGAEIIKLAIQGERDGMVRQA